MKKNHRFLKFHKIVRLKKILTKKNIPKYTIFCYFSCSNFTILEKLLFSITSYQSNKSIFKNGLKIKINTILNSSIFYQKASIKVIHFHLYVSL